MPFETLVETYCTLAMDTSISLLLTQWFYGPRKVYLHLEKIGAGGAATGQCLVFFAQIMQEYFIFFDIGVHYYFLPRV